MNMQGNLGRNIPQTAPQGIAALQVMQRPQQPQQQGQQGLQNIPPDLMRALGVRAALEAEEKAKQQIAAMTQQALEQQIPQTSIAEQDFEKLKSEELAKMTRQIGDQRMAAEQKALRDVSQKMAGIPNIPGAGDGFARMASGGIVAFQEGGLSTGYAPDYTDARRFGIDLSPYDRPEVRAEKLERLRKMREFEKYMKENRAEIPTETPENAELRRLQAKDVGEERYGAMPQPPQAAPQAPAMRMPPAQVRSKVPAGVAGAVQQPVVRPDSTGQGISPPTQQAAPSFTQDLMEGLSKYQTQEFENMSKLAKELYALPPEVRQIYEQRLAQAKQAAQPAPQDFAGRFAKLGGYGPAKGIASAYNQMMSDERAQQEKLRAGVTSAEDALIRAQEAARLKSAETALGARGKAAETFGNVAQVAERRRATDLQAETARLDRETREAIAKMDDKTRRFIADLQARTRQGGELNPDDLARIRANATKAVEESLMKDGRYLALKQKDPAAAERQKQEAIEKMSRDLVQYARSGGATAASAVPAAGQKVIDFASIGAK